MFPKLWDPILSGHFRDMDDFEARCGAGTLGAYSFIEPNFLTDPNDYHPPHDVRMGEQFLSRIWNAVSPSLSWDPGVSLDRSRNGFSLEYDHTA